ncbi:MAG TPA: Ada metal-binding domain-containing protein, partial [Candidatus Binatus sp.]|nr:Ada metal-binding domain-containing protein [Candidatus Binatus sp.]
MQTPSAQSIALRPVDSHNQAVDKERWNAITNRDERYDGSFVFAVRSTGIYCKPSCPARHAAQNQIVFFTRSDDAESSGYRPCKRCRPRELQSSTRAKLIDNICTYIDTNLEEKITLSKIALHANMSPYHLQRTFKRTLGISPREYVKARRLARMKRSL